MAPGETTITVRNAYHKIPTDQRNFDTDNNVGISTTISFKRKLKYKYLEYLKLEALKKNRPYNLCTIV